jgi:hypothetical protein
MVVMFALIRYRDTIVSLSQKSKVKLSLFGVEIETTIPNLENIITAPVGGTLTDQQWALLREIMKEGQVSVAEKKYVMTMQRDLAWIRPIRNAGLIVTLPDGKYIEQAEHLALTSLGKIVVEAKFR